MYEVSFNLFVKDHAKESCPNYLVVPDLERALAVASMLQKVSTPEVTFDAIQVKPAKFD